jgi:hypothetical protein
MSTDGKTFGDIIKISDNSNRWDTLFSPSLVASGNNVYVAWAQRDNANDKFDVFYRMSTDGKTFGDTIKLSNDSNGSIFGVNLLTSGNNVYVGWDQNDYINNKSDVFYRMSTDGKTFGDTIKLSNDSNGSISSPSFVASGNNVYVAWAQRDNANDKSDIFYRMSTDGKTFGDTIKLNDNITRYIFEVDLATSENNVYIGWEQDYDFLYRMSTDGKTFGDTIKLAGSNEGLDLSGLVSYGNKVYVGWLQYYDYNDKSDIFYRMSTDGKTFGDTIKISDNSNDDSSRLSAMHVSKDNVYFSWIQETADNRIKDEIEKENLENLKR